MPGGESGSQENRVRLIRERKEEQANVQEKNPCGNVILNDGTEKGKPKERELLEGLA